MELMISVDEKEEKHGSDIDIKKMGSWWGRGFK
jgi:hypothetical protein